jgi:hypothetical protein
MHCTRHKLRIALGALALVSTAAWSQAFYGAQIAGGWPMAQIAANADWSSDLGADYRYSATANGSAVQWSGQGSHWSSRPDYGIFERAFSLGWEGTARGGSAGQSHSGGELSIDPIRVLTGGATAGLSVYLWSALGDNDPFYGISTDTRYYGYGYIALPTQPVTLHWRLDWASTVQGNAITDAYLEFLQGTVRQHIGGTTGSASGTFAWGGGPPGSWLYPDFRFTSSAADWSLDPRTGRIDTWVTIRFGTEPIPPPVPEPATWTLMAGGLALWGLRRAVARGRRRG